MVISVRAKYKLEWIFLNNSLTTQFEGDTELSSSIIYKKRFITILDPINGEVRPQVQSVFQFTGIKYKYYQKVTVEKGKGDTYYDSNSNEEPGIPQEPVEGILMNPYEQIIKTEFL